MWKERREVSHESIGKGNEVADVEFTDGKRPGVRLKH